MFFDPRRLNTTDDYADDVLVVLPAEWAAPHQRDSEPPAETALTEISNEIERGHPDIRVTLVFKGSREERESGLALRCFIGPRGTAQQFNLGYPYMGQTARFRALADTIDRLMTTYHQRVIDPEGP